MSRSYDYEQVSFDEIDRLREIERLAGELEQAVFSLNRATHYCREDLLEVSRGDIDALKNKARTLKAKIEEGKP